ncbi:MAG: class I SAM-dependent methyltransferase, partial [Promethearchaeota archaeon]
MDKNYLPYEQQKQYYNTKKWPSSLSQTRSEDKLCRMHFIIRNVMKYSKLHRGQGIRIIDLGCGQGWITSELSKYGDVVGVDLSTRVARKLYPNLKFIEANMVIDRIEGKYDIVVSSEVIEHLTYKDQQICIRKAYYLLREDGILILTTPNKLRAVQLCKRLHIGRDQLQPIENWLDKESLSLLLNPYFETSFVGSTMFRPILVIKNSYF